MVETTAHKPANRTRAPATMVRTGGPDGARLLPGEGEGALSRKVEEEGEGTCCEVLVSVASSPEGWTLLLIGAALLLRAGSSECRERVEEVENMFGV